LIVPRNTILLSKLRVFAAFLLAMAGGLYANDTITRSNAAFNVIDTKAGN
jgi:hypothetical protein